MRLALAHGGPPSPPPELWSAWTLDPYVLVLLAAAAAVYWRGARRARRAAGSRTWEAPRSAAFAAGMATLFFALAGPLDALAATLFSAHMAQHLLLMNVAAPLLVLAAPLPVMFRAQPEAARRGLGALLRTRAWRGSSGMLTGPAGATALQQLALWSWHTPAGIAAALHDDAVHAAMHASLVAASLLFWSAVLRPPRHRRWTSLAALAATLKLNDAVCIVLLLLPGVRYAAYGLSAAAWDLSPVEDEQLGWGLMMAVGTPVYLLAAVALFGRWFLPQREPPRAPAAAPGAQPLPISVRPPAASNTRLR